MTIQNYTQRLEDIGFLEAKEECLETSFWTRCMGQMSYGDRCTRVGSMSETNEKGCISSQETKEE